MKDFDLETCQKAATCLEKLSSVCLKTELKRGQDFDVENAVQCMLAFLSTGKLRSATFQIASEDPDYERVKFWRPMLLQHPKVKKWSKVTRVRCELSLFVSLETFILQLSCEDE